MGARIEAACALADHGPRKPRARRLADAASQACLGRAGKEPHDIDMLINTGIYREDSMGEPALAALIQEDISANLGHPPVGGHGTFSFDLANGVCGVISAIQIATGFLESRAIAHGLVVASDVRPYPRGHRDGPFQPTGGAMLLGWDDDIAGFTDFHIETFPEYGELFVSGLRWRERNRHNGTSRAVGRNQLVIDEEPGYQARCADCAVEATRHFLDRLGMSIDEIDLLSRRLPSRTSWTPCGYGWAFRAIGSLTPARTWPAATPPVRSPPWRPRSSQAASLRRVQP